MNRLIDRLLMCLPRARTAFYARGFELPRIYLDAIESMRPRNPQEHDYQHYLDEALREYAGLDGPWHPSVRSRVNPRNRSSYLDLLAAQPEARVPRSDSLDLNFNLFVKAKAEFWQALLERLDEQRQDELRQHAHEFPVTVGTPPPSMDRVIEVIVQIAESQGYRAMRHAAEGVLELRSHADRPIAATLRVVDLPAVYSRGDVVVEFFLDALPNKPFGLNTFVPGGYFYSRWNKTPTAVAFSFYVQCKFLSELTKALERFTLPEPLNAIDRDPPSPSGPPKGFGCLQR